jgi:hypothetical protein
MNSEIKKTKNIFNFLNKKNKKLATIYKSITYKYIKNSNFVKLQQINNKYIQTINVNNNILYNSIGGGTIGSLDSDIQNKGIGIIIAHGATLPEELCIIPDNIYLLPTSHEGDTTSIEIFKKDLHWQTSELRKQLITPSFVYSPNQVIPEMLIYFNPNGLEIKKPENQYVHMGIITKDVDEDTPILNELPQGHSEKNEAFKYSNKAIERMCETSYIYPKERTPLYNNKFRLSDILKGISNYLKSGSGTSDPQVYILCICRSNDKDIRIDLNCGHGDTLHTHVMRRHEEPLPPPPVMKRQVTAAKVQPKDIISTFLSFKDDGIQYIPHGVGENFESNKKRYFEFYGEITRAKDFNGKNILSPDFQNSFSIYCNSNSHMSLQLRDIINHICNIITEDFNISETMYCMIYYVVEKPSTPFDFFNIILEYILHLHFERTVDRYRFTSKMYIYSNIIEEYNNEATILLQTYIRSYFYSDDRNYKIMKLYQRFGPPSSDKTINIVKSRAFAEEPQNVYFIYNYIIQFIKIQTNLTPLTAAYNEAYENALDSTRSFYNKNAPKLIEAGNELNRVSELIKQKNTLLNYVHYNRYNETDFETILHHIIDSYIHSFLIDSNRNYNKHFGVHKS